VAADEAAVPDEAKGNAKVMNYHEPKVKKDGRNPRHIRKKVKKPTRIVRRVSTEADAKEPAKDADAKGLKDKTEKAVAENNKKEKSGAKDEKVNKP
jgi:hypothetical protein